MMKIKVFFWCAALAAAFALPLVAPFKTFTFLSPRQPLTSAPTEFFDTGDQYKILVIKP